MKKLTPKERSAVVDVLEWALAGWADDGELAQVGVDPELVESAIFKLSPGGA